MNKATKKLLEMLSYKRKEGSVGQDLFNSRFVRPMMGKPDSNNNYICEVLPDGKVITDVIHPKSKIAFMAHHDTVHRTDGRQKVFYDPVKQHAYVDHNECLGADCTTGVWLILEMIKAKVPGVYVVHTGEECGGIGSSALVRSKPKWLMAIDAAISFDRMGTNSIITHQMGQRTCSETFSEELESILKMNLISDSGGVYTDSYEYCDVVSECTNISVGYYNQHTPNEYQDVGFALKLRKALIEADWSVIKGHRDPSVIEYEDWYQSRNGQRQGGGWTSAYRSQFDSDYYTTDSSTYNDLDRLDEKYRNIEAVVTAFPLEIAEILSEYGYDKRGLLKDILTHHDRF